MKLAYHRHNAEPDEALIVGCIQENPQAQQALYKRFASKMLGVCYRYVRNREEAEDVMQDGFVKIFNNLSKFRRESSLETWMTRIMVNTALNHLKSTNKFRMESDLELVYNDANLSVSQFQQIDTHLLMKCIQDLPDGYRVVLNMYAIEGYSHKEIGETLGIGESTSRSQFSRAKALLEKQLVSLGLLNEVRYAAE